MHHRSGLNGRSLIYPRGKTLGGCSSINGMLYIRGQARDYDGWAELTGDDAWRWMVGIEAIPALVYTLALLKVPESPRWLILNRNDTRAAAKVLDQIDPHRDNQAQIEEIQEADREDSKVHSRFFSRRYRLPIVLAFLIAFFNFDNENVPKKPLHPML